MVEDLIEDESMLLVGEDGNIFTVDKHGEVDIKAQNEDGITSASVSPTQEYIYIVTKNQTLVQLNNEFDLVKEIPIDEKE